MKKLISCFLLLSVPFFAATLRLKERVEKAHPGEYMVTEAGKTTTLIAVRKVLPHSLILEEISIPSQNVKKKRPPSWPEWVQSGAPGNTSWSMIEIDPQTGQILECFSFSRSCSSTTFSSSSLESSGFLWGFSLIDISLIRYKISMLLLAGFSNGWLKGNETKTADFCPISQWLRN